MIAAFYASLWMGMTKTANRCGYSLSLHGSMGRDLDLIAVPWTEDCASTEELMLALEKKHKIRRHLNQADTCRPHGRMAYSFYLPKDYGEYGNHYIDLSIMPKLEKKE